MITFLGIPFDANSSFLQGPALGPAAIRAAQKSGSANDFSENSQFHFSEMHDAGDLLFGETTGEAAFEIIKKGVFEILERGEKLISLGGDHSISYPILQAIFKKHGPVHILHLDAHGDLYDVFEGNWLSHACPFARILENGLARSLTQIGLRTLNPHQREQARRFGVRQLEMRDWPGREPLAGLAGPIYLSLDLDVLDPAFAPGVSHFEPGGASVRQVLDIIQNLDVEIIGADIVELNPLRDWHGQTAMVGFKFLKEIGAKMTGR